MDDFELLEKYFSFKQDFGTKEDLEVFLEQNTGTKKDLNVFEEFLSKIIDKRRYLQYLYKDIVERTPLLWKNVFSNDLIKLGLFIKLIDNTSILRHWYEGMNIRNIQLFYITEEIIRVLSFITTEQSCSSFHNVIMTTYNKRYPSYDTLGKIICILKDNPNLEKAFSFFRKAESELYLFSETLCKLYDRNLISDVTYNNMGTLVYNLMDRLYKINTPETVEDEINAYKINTPETVEDEINALVKDIRNKLNDVIMTIYKKLDPSCDTLDKISCILKDNPNFKKAFSFFRKIESQLYLFFKTLCELHDNNLISDATYNSMVTLIYNLDDRLYNFYKINTPETVEDEINVLVKDITNKFKRLEIIQSVIAKAIELKQTVQEVSRTTKIDLGKLVSENIKRGTTEDIIAQAQALILAYEEFEEKFVFDSGNKKQLQIIENDLVKITVQLRFAIEEDVLYQNLCNPNRCLCTLRDYIARAGGETLAENSTVNEIKIALDNVLNPGFFRMTLIWMKRIFMPNKKVYTQNNFSQMLKNREQQLNTILDESYNNRSKPLLSVQGSENLNSDTSQDTVNIKLLNVLGQKLLNVDPNNGENLNSDTPQDTVNIKLLNVLGQKLLNVDPNNGENLNSDTPQDIVNIKQEISVQNKCY